MYTTLKMFKKANDLAQKNKKPGQNAPPISIELILEQAKYELLNGNWKEAADLYQSA